jgi:hypothetical protein
VPEEMRVYSETVEVPGAMQDTLTETIRIQRISTMSQDAKDMEVKVEDERYTVTFKNNTATVSDATTINRQWTRWRSQAESLRKAVYTASFAETVQTTGVDEAIAETSEPNSQYTAVIAEAERNQEAYLPQPAALVQTDSAGDLAGQYRSWERNAAAFYAGYNFTLSRMQSGAHGLEYMLMQDERDFLTAQEKMAVIRESAVRRGVTIAQSVYETKSLDGAQ